MEVVSEVQFANIFMILAVSVESHPVSLKATAILTLSSRPVPSGADAFSYKPNEILLSVMSSR